MFQQSSEFLIGEGGPGLGYQGLKGAMVIEFDYHIDRYQNDPGDSYAHIAVIGADGNGVLTSNHLYEITSNRYPINLANNLKPGFS